MKITSLLRGARTPQNPLKVPFQPILPIHLRDKVSGKGEKTADVSCLQEMALLFSCLAENEFKESFCPKEVESFQSCYKTNLAKKFQKKQEEAQGGIGRNVGSISSATVNRLLRRFPSL
ncbi:coiled-coil-helix-coiled-coil-helix domain-containing protein 1 [Neodiprion lecontei]|uniref:Coiled-coil-helix-coiled-coil-helix domain-containing protein 1 n=1 Tax=Neodiprion lecontei TaxID=441921 RepID=A0A6J0BAH0_NEOLC|nr:coiled-coil-helix-coiled-coil-helix domain-containing protein 1 [Neodiprion lecontei]XP_015510688.1 coiled-coil-helix-coiled-coil-helix domain-containing protein 1 [Neodiprion lecontei]XP_046597530.1 coiled-coil-helix-coiled-coil-helix domain-containing protein 1 [Neodiprion lecontei]